MLLAKDTAKVCVQLSTVFTEVGFLVQIFFTFFGPIAELRCSFWRYLETVLNSECLNKTKNEQLEFLTLLNDCFRET